MRDVRFVHVHTRLVTPGVSTRIRGNWLLVLVFLFRSHRDSARERNRSERYIIINSTTTNDLDLLVAVAHELGHVLLDTSEHTVGGVMGGSSSQLQPVDYELACAAIGVCIEP